MRTYVRLSLRGTGPLRFQAVVHVACGQGNSFVRSVKAGSVGVEHTVKFDEPGAVINDSAFLTQDGNLLTINSCLIALHFHCRFMERLKKRTNLSKAFPVFWFEKFGLQGIIVGFGVNIDGTLMAKSHFPPGPIVKWDHPSSYFLERLYSTR